MISFILGGIRQLTTRRGTRIGDLTTLVGEEGIAKSVVVRSTRTGRVPSEHQKQLNIRIRRAGADIVTRLIVADIIRSQQAEVVEGIVYYMLRRAFEGATLAAEGREQQVRRKS